VGTNTISALLEKIWLLLFGATVRKRGDRDYSKHHTTAWDFWDTSVTLESGALMLYGKTAISPTQPAIKTCLTKETIRITIRPRIDILIASSN